MHYYIVYIFKYFAFRLDWQRKTR